MKFGVAGYPPAFYKSKFGKDRLSIIPWLAELGLDALELQMTYGPKTSVENCLKYKALSIEYNIKLSIHGSYFIVMTSKEEDKIIRSIDTLLKTYELAEILGANEIVLHPGSRYNNSPIESLTILMENLNNFFDKLGNTNIELYLETAGKRGQFGSVEEILEVSTKMKECNPCIDFGHVHAYNLGSLSNCEEIDNLFTQFEDYRNDSSKNKFHFHYTPIDFGRRGEITHKALDDVYPDSNQLSLSIAPNRNSDLYNPRPKHIIKNFLKYSFNNTVISETYNSQEEGATIMKKLYFDQV